MSSLTAAYLSFISPSSPTPGVVDANEAQQLVDIAGNINAQKSGCCYASHAGDRELRQIFNSAPDRFDPAAQSVVQGYLNPARVSRPVIVAPVPIVRGPIFAPIPVIAPRFGLGWGWSGGGFRHGGFGHHGHR